MPGGFTAPRQSARAGGVRGVHPAGAQGGACAHRAGDPGSVGRGPRCGGNPASSRRSRKGPLPHQVEPAQEQRT